jgi:hypothetical protein
VIAIVNRDMQASETVRFQNRWFRGRQGAKEIRINRRVYLLVGSGFIVFGLFYLVAGD